MDPILTILLIAALVAFILALIWSIAKPKRKEPIIEPVENKPLPPIDDQIFDDVIQPTTPIFIEETSEDENNSVEDLPIQEPVFENPTKTEVDENIQVEETETKNTQPQLSDRVYDVGSPSDSGWSDSSWSDSGGSSSDSGGSSGD